MSALATTDPYGLLPIPVDEDRFRKWYDGIVKRRGAMGMPLGPADDPRQEYDFRGLFQSGWTPPANWEKPEGGAGHFPSRQKTDANLRAIVGGIDTKSGQQVAPTWYTGPKSHAPSNPAADPYADLPIPGAEPAPTTLTPSQIAAGTRLMPSGTLRDVTGAVNVPGVLGTVERAAQKGFEFLSQPFVGAPQTDLIAAASRGLLHGATQPISTPKIAPLLQKPQDEPWLSSKVEDVSDIIGQFLPIGMAIRGVRVGMEAVGLARRLAPWFGRIVENGGAGALFRVAEAVANDPDGFAKMDRKQAVLYLAQQAGIGAANWGAYALGLEGGAGFLQAAIKNGTLRPSVLSIFEQINRHGRDEQVEAELKAVGQDPTQVRTALNRFWPLLSAQKKADLSARHPGLVPEKPTLPTIQPPAEPAPSAIPTKPTTVPGAPRSLPEMSSELKRLHEHPARTQGPIASDVAIKNYLEQLRTLVMHRRPDLLPKVDDAINEFHEGTFAIPSTEEVLGFLHQDEIAEMRHAEGVRKSVYEDIPAQLGGVVPRAQTALEQAHAAAAPEIQRLHAFATLQREGYLQDLRDIAQEIQGAVHPEGIEDMVAKSPAAIREKLVERGKDVTDALRSTVVVKSLDDVTGVRKGLEGRGYQVVNFQPPRGMGGYAEMTLRKGADDPLVKELRVMTPSVFHVKRILDTNDIDRFAESLLKETGDTPEARVVLEGLRGDLDRVYSAAGALDSSLAPTSITEAMKLAEGNAPILSKSLTSMLQERAKTLRDPASSTGMSSLSQNTFLADRLEAFATRHSPSTPIVPQAGAEEAAQEFQVPPSAPGGGGEAPPPPGEPPPPPTGEEPPEPLRPLPGTLAEVGETARQRGPTLIPGEPGYQMPPGTSPTPPPPTPPLQRVVQGLKTSLGALQRLAALDPTGLMFHERLPWLTPAAQKDVSEVARGIVGKALGQRDFDSVMSNREWAEKMLPEIRRLAALSSDLTPQGKPMSLADKTVLLDEALAWKIDTLRNGAEVDAYLPEAMRKADASDHPVLKRLRQIVARAMRLTPEELKLAGAMDAYDQDRGLLRLNTDVQEGLLDFHIGHIWEATKEGAPTTTPAGVSQRLRSMSVFSKGRTYSTFARGIAEGGLAPRTLRATIINRIEDMDTAHVLMSRQIVNSLVESGAGVWSDTRVPDMRGLGSENPMFRKGAQQLYVPEDVWPLVRPFVESGKPFIGADLQKLQGLVKRMELSLSFYHDFHLAGMYIVTHPLDPVTYEGLPEMAGAAAKGVWQFITTGSLEGAPGVYELWGPVRRGLEYATNPTDVMKMLYFGGHTDTSTKVLDAYHDMLHPEKKNVWQNFEAIRSRALWDRLWKGLKAYDAVQTGQDFLRTIDKTTNPRTGVPYTPQEAMDALAAFYNKKYGGLNWDRMGTAQQTRLNMRAMLFAPDWLLSNLGFVGDGLKGINDLRAGRNTVESKVALKDLRTLAITWMTLTQAASLMLNGYTTWDNEPGHEFQLEIPVHGQRGQREYVDVTTPAAFLTLTHLLGGGTAGARTGTGLGPQNILTRTDAAAKGIGDRVRTLLAARLAYLPRTAEQYMSNTAFGGRPLFPPGQMASERLKTAALQTVFQAAPFTVQAGLRASPAGEYLPGGQITLGEATSQLAGVGAPSVGIVVDKTVFDRGLSKRNKVDFIRNLSPQERIEFRRQFHGGRFTGDIGAKLRAAANRQQFEDSSASQRETQMLERGQVREAVRHMAERGMSAQTIRTKILPYLMQRMGPRDKQLQEATP